MLRAGDGGGISEIEMGDGLSDSESKAMSRSLVRNNRGTLRSVAMRLPLDAIRELQHCAKLERVSLTVRRDYWPDSMWNRHPDDCPPEKLSQALLAMARNCPNLTSFTFNSQCEDLLLCALPSLSASGCCSKCCWHCTF